MNSQWDMTKIQQYITDGVQESLILEYKAANALGKTDGKRNDISQDVSAMANSSGGILIYGIKEFDEDDKRHLPEKIDPISLIEFSKEWLEQVINNIRPKINGIIIHSIAIDSMPSYVIYVVEVPKSTTAHQATTLRYYKRFNFQCVAMEDYEIRDVMNRASTPDAAIEFGLMRIVDDAPSYACRRLSIKVTNKSTQVINRFKLNLSIKNIGWVAGDGGGFVITDIRELGDSKTFTYSYCSDELSERLNIDMVYQSKEVLFPKESINIGGYNINWEFFDEPEWNNQRWLISAIEGDWIIDWTLYADNMPYKKGNISIHELAFQ
jgi:hypothetical protein